MRGDYQRIENTGLPRSTMFYPLMPARIYDKQKNIKYNGVCVHVLSGRRSVISDLLFPSEKNTRKKTFQRMSFLY